MILSCFDLILTDCPYGDREDYDCDALIARYGPLRCSQGTEESKEFNGQICCKTCLDVMDTSDPGTNTNNL